MDTTTMFEWQRHSHVPHYDDLLKFLNLRAQASESTASESVKKAAAIESHAKKLPFGKRVASHAGSIAEPSINCAACKGKHPIYTCPKFKALT